MKKEEKAKKNVFDFEAIRQSPAVQVAEQEIVDGFENLNNGVGEQSHSMAPQLEQHALTQTEDRGRFDNEPTKGVQANMPISIYNRMKKLKFETDESFQSMFQRAMDLFLDVEEGKMKVSKAQNPIKQ